MIAGPRTARSFGVMLLAVTAVQPAISPAAGADQKGDKPRPPELGAIEWLRGFDVAAEKAKAEAKPLLVLFQEVPGCGTCVTYGDKVLSHPLIVDAAETLFVPVAIYNNVKGADERTLESFKEPAWNNPVVRIMAHDGQELAGRVANDYSVGGLAIAMTDALKRRSVPVPLYLRLLAQESRGRKRGLETATLAMHCFWEGESALGAVEGVIATRPGMLQSKEVVEVQFDPSAVSFEELLNTAKARDCAGYAFTRTDAQQLHAAEILGSLAARTDETIAPDKQPKYYLAQTPYRYVPMTPLQAARVNAAIHKTLNKKGSNSSRQAPEDPSTILSPRQVKLLRLIELYPDAGWQNVIGAQDVPRAWSAAAKTARSLGRPL